MVSKPVGLSETDLGLKEWRRKAVTVLLLIAVTTGLPAYAVAVASAVRQGQMTPLIVGYVACYLGGIGLLILPRIDYRTKAWVFIGLSLMNAAASFGRLGLFGSGRLWLVVLPIIAAVILGARAAYIIAGSGIALYGVFMGLAHFRVLEGWLAAPPDSLALGFWIEGGTALLVFIPVMVVLVERYVRIHSQALDDVSRAKSQLERLTEDLRKSEKEYRSVIENIQDVFYRSDTAGRLVMTSPSGAAMFRYGSVGEMFGLPLETFWADPKGRESLVDQVRATGGVRDFEAVLKRRDGATFKAALTTHFYYDEGGKFLGTEGIIRDITEHRRAEEETKAFSRQLRDLSAKMEMVREEERAAISREIHDELGQALTALKMDVAWLAQRQTEKADVFREKTQAMSRLIDTTVGAVRRISSELRPWVLDELGLGAAIEWQTQQFQSRTGIRCQYPHLQENLPLDKELSTAIFRIFQEALTNVARHARATRVAIGLESGGGRVVLTVADNGKGITDEESTDRRSLGILGMRERAHIFGGEFRIVGEPGRGTTVTLIMPAEGSPDSSRKDSEAKGP